MSIRYFVEKNSDRARSYELYMLGSVWVDQINSKRPLMAVWATDQGSNRPIAAGIYNASHWIAEGNGYKNRGFERQDVDWSKTDIPNIYHQEIRGENMVSFITTAIYRKWFAVNPLTNIDDSESVQFVILPSASSLKEDIDPDLINKITKEFRDYGYFRGIDDNYIKKYFTNYADLVYVYLSRRVKYPLLRSPICRYLILALLLDNNMAKFQYTEGSYYNNARSNEGHFECPGMEDLGYGHGLYVNASQNSIQKLCEFIPAEVTKKFGEKMLTSEVLPDKFLQG
jgi:hypothetical protein